MRCLKNCVAALRRGALEDVDWDKRETSGDNILGLRDHSQASIVMLELFGGSCSKLRSSTSTEHVLGP